MQRKAKCNSDLRLAISNLSLRQPRLLWVESRQSANVRNGWKAELSLLIRSKVTRFPAFKTQLHLARETLRFFYIQRVRGFDAPTRPHMDLDAVNWLERRLQRTRLFLEFGSGGSTILANKLAVPSITVESDRFYGAVVRRAMINSDLTTMVIPKMGITGQWGMPLFFKRRKGPRYVTAPFELIDESYPDLILVDGRYRVACTLEAARRANVMGASAELMLDDYDGRLFYHVLENYLGTPKRIGRAAVFAIGKTPIQEDAVRTFLTDPR